MLLLTFGFGTGFLRHGFQHAAFSPVPGTNGIETFNGRLASWLVLTNDFKGKDVVYNMNQSHTFTFKTDKLMSQ